MNMKEEIKTKNRIGILDRQAMVDAIDTTIVEMKKIYNGMSKDQKQGGPCFVWISVKKSDNMNLLNLFDVYGSEVSMMYYGAGEDKKSFYHLIKTIDAYLPYTDEIVDSLRTAQDHDAIVHEDCTSETIAREHPYFQVYFDFKENNGNCFCHDSPYYAEKVYRFLLGQLERLGIQGKIEVINDL